jgi:hypothetical protein
VAPGVNFVPAGVVPPGGGVLVEDELVAGSLVGVDVEVVAGAAALEVLWLADEEPHPLTASTTPTAAAAASALRTPRVADVIVISRMIPFSYVFISSSPAS